MDLEKYDGKHVRITDKRGEIFAGMAKYGNHDFLECEYGGEEDGIFIEDCLIYNSQIVSIEEIEVHGTVELWTERMVLRRYRPEDADDLYHYLGTDPAMYEYSGWNPYASWELAQETVRRFIDSYNGEILMHVRPHGTLRIVFISTFKIDKILAHAKHCSNAAQAYSVQYRTWCSMGQFV